MIHAQTALTLARMFVAIESRQSTVAGAIQTVNGGFTPSSAGRGIANYGKRFFIE